MVWTSPSFLPRLGGLSIMILVPMLPMLRVTSVSSGAIPALTSGQFLRAHIACNDSASGCPLSNTTFSLGMEGHFSMAWFSI